MTCSALECPFAPGLGTTPRCDAKLQTALPLCHQPAGICQGPYLADGHPASHFTLPWPQLVPVTRECGCGVAASLGSCTVLEMGPKRVQVLVALGSTQKPQGTWLFVISGPSKGGAHGPCRRLGG